MKPEISEKKDISLIERMFNVGAHFGYSRTRRHPTYKSIIFGSKNNTDIINLEQTHSYLNKALEFVKELARDGKTVLFVGTKPEANKAIKEAGIELEMPYVIHRWIGGTLTNFIEIRKRVERLIDLQKQKEEGDLKKYTKKEQRKIDEVIDKLLRNFGGIVSMDKLPNAIFVIDFEQEDIASAEARNLNIPVVSLSSSDCNIKNVDYLIPANDSSKASIGFFVDKVVEAYKEGKKQSIVALEEKKSKEKEEDNK